MAYVRGRGGKGRGRKEANLPVQLFQEETQESWGEQEWGARECKPKCVCSQSSSWRRGSETKASTKTKGWERAWQPCLGKDARSVPPVVKYKFTLALYCGSVLVQNSPFLSPVIFMYLTNSNSRLSVVACHCVWAPQPGEMLLDLDATNTWSMVIDEYARV